MQQLQVQGQGLADALDLGEPRDPARRSLRRTSRISASKRFGQRLDVAPRQARNSTSSSSS